MKTEKVRITYGPGHWGTHWGETPEIKTPHRPPELTTAQRLEEVAERQGLDKNRLKDLVLEASVKALK